VQQELLELQVQQEWAPQEPLAFKEQRVQVLMEPQALRELALQALLEPLAQMEQRAPQVLPDLTALLVQQERWALLASELRVQLASALRAPQEQLARA
jgi:hypothetical protein